LPALLGASSARAEDAKPVTAQDIHLDSDPEGSPLADGPREPPPEAPPLPPRHKGVVLDANLGLWMFMGQARNVATPGLHARVFLGYEVLSWLMVFGNAELVYTSTARAEDPPYTRAFPIFGFGGGVRATVHLTPRVALFAEPSVGALKADIATGALTNLGMRDAESLAPYFGGRLGVEWYQLDRHFALGAAVGSRLATGFARSGAESDTPFTLEAQASLRYTF
jgi:hypothetical protein